jgi:hypothetical protein
MRLILGAATFGWIALFGLGLLRGDVRESGWLYFLLGALAGISVAALTRKIELPRSAAGKAARLVFLFALVLLVWGLLGLVAGRDPVTGASFLGLSRVMAEFLLLVSAAPAFLGFLLLAMRRR